MSDQALSLIVKCWRDDITGMMGLSVVRVDTNEEIRLRAGSFLLRITHAGDGAIERCYIRHIASGREAYVQGGPNLRTFVSTCLLESRQEGAQ